MVSLLIPSNTATDQDDNFSGNPLSLITFRFTFDQAAWLIIGDRQQMTKFKPGVYQTLGIPQPPDTGLVGIVATDAGAGNLNSTGGPGYDWRITFYNNTTGSESPPSQIMGAPFDIVHTTVLTTPDPDFGGNAAVGPNTVTSGTFGAASADELRQSARWKTFGTLPTPPYNAMYLDIQGSFVTTGTGGTVYGAIEFSIDGGVTWNLYHDFSNAVGSHQFGGPATGFTGLPGPGLIRLSAGQDPTKVQVRAVVFGIGASAAPQQVICRRIRDLGGNFAAEKGGG